MLNGHPTTCDTRALESRLGHFFARPGLLEEALCHRSFAFENPTAPWRENERLEFLGDAVLQLCISRILTRRFPRADEGALTRLRAWLVSEATLAELARGVELGGFLKLGRGEALSGGAEKPSILADALEAVLGAVFLDGGFDPALDTVRRLWGERLEHLRNTCPPEEEAPRLKDPKTRLQELLQKVERTTPCYKLVGSSGPDHQRTFFVEVHFKGRPLGSGQGRSKKDAEQEAAQTALRTLAAQAAQQAESDSTEPGRSDG